jgi:hypothetical protein
MKFVKEKKRKEKKRKALIEEFLVSFNKPKQA